MGAPESDGRYLFHKLITMDRIHEIHKIVSHADDPEYFNKLDKFPTFLSENKA